MGKQPVEFDLYEWMVLTDLIKATPDHKGSDVYGLSKLTKTEIEGRFSQFQKLTHFDAL